MVVLGGGGGDVAQMLRSSSVQQLLSCICTCAMLRCVLFEKPWSCSSPWADRYDAWLLIELTPKGVVFSFLFLCSSKVCLTFQPMLQRKPQPADPPVCPLLALKVCPPRCSLPGTHYCPCSLPCLLTPDYHLPACRWNHLPRCLLHWWKCWLLLSKRC